MQTNQIFKLLVLSFISLQLCDGATAAAAAEEKKQDGVKNQVTTRLDCQPGELRHFNYESSTRVWGSANQQVQLRASLRLRCMESPLNTTLKYLAEILSLEPVFQNGMSNNNNNKENLASAPKSPAAPALHAEPVFEEVSEAIQLTANRMKRSLSGWFGQAWSSVKDFFVNIFNSSERSSVSRDQAYGESGIDIANQCKSKRKPGAGLPIDDSVFDDLEPKYYISASSADPLVGTAYVFGDGDDDEDDLPASDEDANLSFFDDPKVKSRIRSKRATKAPVDEKSQVGDKQLKLPFIFFQSRMGKIIEVRFSGEETDLLVKNFKRHLCDLFATNLDKTKNQLNEISPIGQHTTKYLLDSSDDSSAIKQLLAIKSNSTAQASSNSNGNNNKELASNKQLVRVLASRQPLTVGATGSDDDDDDDTPGVLVQARDPNADGRPGDSLSVLRSINSTSSIKLNSRTISPDIERLQVQVEQVQQINDGRMTHSAGQLGVSLFQQQQQPSNSNRGGRHRSRRSIDQANSGGGNDAEVGDIADLLQVSSTYSVQLVPLSKLGNFSAPWTLAEVDQQPPTFVTLDSESSGGSGSGRQQKGSARPKRAAATQVEISRNSTTTTTQRRQPNKASAREPLVIKPASGEELEKSLREMRSAESKLQLTRSSSLLPESNDGAAYLESSSDSSIAAMQTRLELIRDQIQMRLNEEFMRNRLRERTLDAIRQHAQAVQDLSASSSSSKKLQQKKPNSLGLGLTQLVLDSGITSKRKGSVYSTIEEALELESQLEEDSQDGSVSKLLRETIRLDKLKQHCKSSIATMAEIRSQSARLEMRAPFSTSDDFDQLEREKFARIVQRVEDKNKRRLEQCRQVVQLMLRVGDKKVADLIVDLIDECNTRLVQASKDEELGFGPASKYYRNLRQQFIELMASVSKPNELLLDRLMSRLQMASQSKGGIAAAAATVVVEPVRRKGSTTQEPEFTYVNSRSSSSSGAGGGGGDRYNKSLLRDEDYAINNNDVVGSLLMTLTSLASRPNIRQEKRVQLAEKLLVSIKSSSCSPFDGPDLDILESMGNFHQPLDEIVGKIVHLAKKCRHQDQYVVACVHGLRGQVQHATSQKFFQDLLKSSNVSCTVKSEIVLTLVDVILIEDLKAIQPLLRDDEQSSNNNQARSAARDDKAATKWPAYGMNKLDDTLIDLIDLKSGKSSDRKCLAGLIRHYLSKKHQLDNDILSAIDEQQPISSSSSSNQKRRNRESRRRGMGMRFKRAVINDDKFWDEAQCKRWLLPDVGSNSSAADSNLLNSMATDLASDDIDDNSISLAIANSKKSASRGARKNELLLEREVSGEPSSAQGEAAESFIRKRHKCTASKKYGPKNAEAILRAEIVNDLVGAKDENKFLARFRLGTNFLGNRIDVGRMYLWHQKQTTRAHVNILGKSLWDTSQSCTEKSPHHLLYMPLFDFNLWLVKVSVGLKLQSEMGFFSNCQQQQQQRHQRDLTTDQANTKQDQLELYPTISLRASGEASAKFVMARAGMSLASQYGYQGNIRVSRQPNSCMSIKSAHQPMNVTFSSWFQLWDSDCHYWGSRNRAEPQATRWRLAAKQPTVWLDDECLSDPRQATNQSESSSSSSSSSSLLSRRSATQPSTISP